VLYSGIDQHKLDSVITTYSASGERLRQRRLRNERSALVRYFAEFPGPHRAVVETTGRWYWLRDLLVAQGIELQLAHAKRLKAISTAKVKTDAIDSDTLAKLCQADVIPLAHIRRLEHELNPEVLRLPDVQRLLWIPGIGKLGARTIALEVDDIARFLSDRKFVSYCRLVPGADNSAGKTRHRSGSKDGNRYLKIAFTHAGIRAIQYYPEIKAWYTRLARRKNVRVARTLVAKELARIVYHVLRTQTDYNGTFKGKPLSRTKRSQWPRLASPDAELIRPLHEAGSRA
jgi:transposase